MGLVVKMQQEVVATYFDRSLSDTMEPATWAKYVQNRLGSSFIPGQPTLSRQLAND